MKRKLAVWVLLAGLAGGGTSAVQAGKYMSQAWSNPMDGAHTGARYAPEAPGMIGPYGQPVMQTAGASYQEPTGADLARAALAAQYPPEMLRQAGIPPGAPPLPPGMPGGVVNAAYQGGPPGGGIMQTAGGNGYNLPSGYGPPVPGVAPPGPPGAVAALGALTGQHSPFGVSRTEVRFVGPAGMKISWYAPSTDGKSGFTTQFLEAPARYNFLQSSIYRLKLSDIPNRPGVDLYPTLQVEPANGKTATFLAHSAVPISFTEEDFEQVAAGNFVVKVIYLPDPQFQDLATTGPDEVVSSRLEPGVDPILEAKRRGSILAIVRLGNIDLEAPNTPAMDSPDQNVVRAQQQQAAQQQAYLRALQQQMLQQQIMMRAMAPTMGGMPPNMAGMMPPGMMPPGMMPPGMVPPGMIPPGMPRPGMTPTLPASQGLPASPTIPLPITPGTPAAPASPLGKLPTSAATTPTLAGLAGQGAGR